MADRRAIFQEVTEAAPPKGPTPGGIDRDRSRARGWLRAWQASLFVLVVMMILLGGATRLTDSGLSITEWAPITGAIPPLSAADWEAAFADYRETDEYRLQNFGMSMADFRVIFWWEWGHRQLGRVIGLVWALGFAGFVAARQIPPGWTTRLLIPGLLGGVQAVIGWWMVSSGLEPGRLDVASYRLAIHLGLAFVILGLLAWNMLLLSRPDRALIQARRSGDRQLKGLSTGLLHLAFLQILLGALVAGIDAGRTFTDWPLMAGGFFPPEMWVLEPLWRNLFENAGTVQFLHRVVGYLLLVFALAVAVAARRSGVVSTRMAFVWIAVGVTGQAILGIITVLYGAPIRLGLPHQFGAVVVISLILYARFLAMYPRPQSVRDGGGRP